MRFQLTHMIVMLIVMMRTQDLIMRVMIRGEGLLCPYA